MPDGFQVEPALLRGAAESVEECCRQIEAGRKTGAAAGVSSGMDGFAVASACATAGEASLAAFTGVAKSWRAWSEAAASGAVEYAQSDLGGVAALRAAATEAVV